MVKNKIIVIGLAMGILMGCFGSKVTEENFNQVKDGMTLDEIKTFLGEPTQSSLIGSGTLSAGTAEWQSQEGATITIQFISGKATPLRSFKKQ